MDQWYYSKDTDEIVITTPYTPRPWINYLTNGRYFALTSQTGGGFSFYLDPSHHVITRREQDMLLNDRPGRFVFVQDMADGDYWNIGGNPSGVMPEQFSCKHGLGYTILESLYKEIRSTQEIYVLREADAEVWSLSFENTGNHSRHVRVFAYVEWILGTGFTDPVARTFDCFFKHAYVDHGVIIGRKLRWGLRGQRENKPWEYESFVTSTRKPKQIWLDKHEFIGAYRDISRPIALENRVMSPHSDSEVWAVDVIGTQEWELMLDRGESAQWEVLVGLGRYREAVERALSLADSTTLHSSKEEVKDHWRKCTTNLQVKTPDEDLNRLSSCWTPYQIIIKSFLSSAPSYYHASDGSPGFRDAMQDAFGLCMLEPQRARELVIRLCSFQYRDGAAAHRAPWVPLKPERSEKSDLPLWIPLAVLQYVRETGDTSIILEQVPYITGDASVSNETYTHGLSVLEHIDAGLERSLKDTGRHGLPLIHYGDWNDALDGLGGEGLGESVFLGQFLAFSLKNAGILAKLVGKKSFEKRWMQKRNELISLINEHCWDKDRFVRAFHDDGTVIGCRKDKEGRLYLNPQVWAVIGELAPRERLEICMDTVERELDTPFGIRCLAPPYSHYSPHVGLISCFPPGIKENGGIFSHAMAFCLVGELMLKRAEKAWDIFCKANPLLRSRKHPEYGVEPYVYSQFVAGPETNLSGKGYHHWLTSTCSWMQYAIINWMFGVRADFDGILVDPCIPSHWKGFQFSRPFRGSMLHVSVKNPKGRNWGVKKMTMNGKAVLGTKIPLPLQDEVEIRVDMG